MADYKDKEALTYAKAENMEAKVGARAYGDRNEKANVSMLEADAKAGANYSVYGAGAEAKAGAQVFNYEDETSKTAVKAFGVEVRVSGGADLEAFIKKGHKFGAEAKAKATMVDCKAGPIGLHLGVGVSTGLQVEDSTFDAKLAGCGLKVGKRIGVSVFDNEFSLETLSIFGKGWLWGKFD